MQQFASIALIVLYHFADSNLHVKNKKLKQKNEFLKFQGYNNNKIKPSTCIV
jgi:hypothetical protein